jgi:hypothetical protein
MIDEKGKSKIVEEVKSGMISCLGASRKYGFQEIVSRHGQVRLI